MFFRVIFMLPEVHLLPIKRQTTTVKFESWHKLQLHHRNHNWHHPQVTNASSYAAAGTRQSLGVSAAINLQIALCLPIMFL